MDALQVIARIHTELPEKFGVPRQSGLVPQLRGRIVFEPAYRNPDAVRGLEDFSHLWLIWQFSGAIRQDWSPTVRPPRLGGNRRMGVFATRSPFHPNHLGLSSVRLEGATLVRCRLATCRLTGADLIRALLRQVEMTGCKADFLNLAEAKTDHVRFAECAMQEAALESVTLKQAEFADCDLTRATVHMTAMKGVDLRSCRLDGLNIGIPDMRGMVVTPLQAAELARLLGLVIKD